MNLLNPLPRVFAVMAIMLAGLANAAVISVGPQTTNVPSYFGSVALGTGQFLVPINVSGASGLQEWQFDFSFDPNVVTQIEPFFTPYSFGLYAAQFDPSDPSSLSSPTSAGFSFTPGLIEQIAGFSQGATGNGALAFLAFEYLQPDSDPNFAVSNVTVTQSVPEPSTLSLVALVMAGLAFIRRAARASTKVATGS
jgi:hypothetical protein